MPRRTKKDLLALVNGHHTNPSKAEAGERVYIRRDENEAWGKKYDEGPKSAKSYNYRANRLERHGWVEGVNTSDVAPATRAVGTLTETGEKILKAAYNRTEEWEAWNNHELGTGEFINAATEESEDDEDFEHGEPAEVSEDDSSNFTCHKCNQTWYDERIKTCPCCDSVYSEMGSNRRGERVR